MGVLALFLALLSVARAVRKTEVEHSLEAEAGWVESNGGVWPSMQPPWRMALRGKKE